MLESQVKDKTLKNQQKDQKYRLRKTRNKMEDQMKD